MSTQLIFLLRDIAKRFFSDNIDTSLLKLKNLKQVLNHTSLIYDYTLGNKTFLLKSFLCAINGKSGNLKNYRQKALIKKRLRELTFLHFTTKRDDPQIKKQNLAPLQGLVANNLLLIKKLYGQTVRAAVQPVSAISFLIPVESTHQALVLSTLSWAQIAHFSASSPHSAADFAWEVTSAIMAATL